MRIGILTYHRAINLGSIIQAYCVQKKLRRLFPSASVEVIDYRPGARDIRETTKFVRRIPPFIHLDELKNIVSMRKYLCEVLPLTKDSLTTRDLGRAVDWIDAKNYDVLVVGSDTVWEYRSGSYSPPDVNIFHLPWKTSALKIAFAVSSDPVPEISAVQPSHRKELAKWIGDFDLVLPRDAATSEFIASLGVDTTKHVPVLDPTLLTSFSELVREADNRLARLDVLTAGVSLPGNLSRRVLPLLASKNFKILSWRGEYSRERVTKIPPGLHPGEILGHYAAIDAFITDRFHGSIFAMKIGGVAPIFIEDSTKWPKANSKGRDLYRRLGIEDRVVRDDDPRMEQQIGQLLSSSRLGEVPSVDTKMVDHALITTINHTLG